MLNHEEFLSSIAAKTEAWAREGCPDVDEAIGFARQFIGLTCCPDDPTPIARFLLSVLTAIQKRERPWAWGVEESLLPGYAQEFILGALEQQFGWIEHNRTESDLYLTERGEQVAMPTLRWILRQDWS